MVLGARNPMGRPSPRLPVSPSPRFTSRLQVPAPDRRWMSPPRPGPHRPQARPHRSVKLAAVRYYRRRQQRGGWAVVGLASGVRGDNDARARGDGRVVARAALPVPSWGAGVHPFFAAGGGTAAAAAPLADGDAARTAHGAVAIRLQFPVPEGLAGPWITARPPFVITMYSEASNQYVLPTALHVEPTPRSLFFPVLFNVTRAVPPFIPLIRRRRAPPARPSLAQSVGAAGSVSRKRARQIWTMASSSSACC